MTPLSNILLALMYFAKNEWPKDQSLTWEHVGKALIRADYDRAYEKLGAVLQLVVPAYVEALGHPQLRVPGGERALAQVFMAPFASHFALEWPQWRVKLDNEYPLESIYNTMFEQMMSDLMLTTVSECPQYLEYAEAVKNGKPAPEYKPECWACGGTKMVTTSSNGSGLIEEPCAACKDD
jgi:hypothetical protein